jgi:hypothetical protein
MSVLELGINWKALLKLMGQPHVRPQGLLLCFSFYDQIFLQHGMDAPPLALFPE